MMASFRPIDAGFNGEFLGTRHRGKIYSKLTAPAAAGIGQAIGRFRIGEEEPAIEQHPVDFHRQNAGQVPVTAARETKFPDMLRFIPSP